MELGSLVFFVTFAAWFHCCCFQDQFQERKYLISAGPFSNNTGVVLRVSSETQEVSFTEPTRKDISRYCNGGSDGCEILVLGGHSFTATASNNTVFLPVNNGVWLVTLSLGNSVVMIGQSTLTYRVFCETVGIFDVYGSYIAVCTDNDGLLHACVIDVDLNNASSITDHCGGMPESLRRHLMLSNGAPISNVVQTGSRYREAQLHFFSGTILYIVSIIDNVVLDPHSVPLNCDFVTRIQLLAYNNGSAYLYCNDSSIYLYNVVDYLSEPHLVRNGSEHHYPCISGSYSIADNEVLYRFPSRNNSDIRLPRPITRGLCIGHSSLLYEDVEPTLNLIIVPHDHLEHTIIDSRNPSNYRVLQNLYVALFRPGSISTTEADTLDFIIFPSSSAAFPSLLYLVNVRLLSGTSTESPATSPLPMDNLTTYSMLLGNLTTYLTPTKLATHEEVTSEAPVINSTDFVFVIVVSTVSVFLFIISSLMIIFLCCYFYIKSNRLRCRQSDTDNLNPLETPFSSPTEASSQCDQDPVVVMVSSTLPAMPSELQPNEDPVESSIINPVVASGPHDHGISMVVPDNINTHVSDESRL